MYLHSRNERGAGNAYYVLLLIILIMVAFFLSCDFGLLSGDMCGSVEGMVDKISQKVNSCVSIKY